MGLDQLKNFFDKILTFTNTIDPIAPILTRYTKTGMHMDLESFYFEQDSKFSNHCNFKLAEMMAKELLRIYLRDELYKLEHPIQQTT